VKREVVQNLDTLTRRICKVDSPEIYHATRWSRGREPIVVDDLWLSSQDLKDPVSASLCRCELHEGTGELPRTEDDVKLHVRHRCMVV